MVLRGAVSRFLFFPLVFFLRRALSTQGVRILEDDVYSGRKEDADDDGRRERERFLGLRRCGRGQQREGIDRDDDAD